MFCMHVSVHHMCTWWKKVLDHLTLELWTIMSHNVHDGSSVRTASILNHQNISSNLSLKILKKGIEACVCVYVCVCVCVWACVHGVHVHMLINTKAIQKESLPSEKF